MKCCILDFFVVLKQKSKTTEMASCLFVEICKRVLEIFLCTSVVM